MRLVAFSDLHIHNYRQFDKDGSRLENCLRVLDEVFEYAGANNIEHILFAGDMFDMQKQVPTIVMNKTIQRFDYLLGKYPKIRFMCISGNHDYGAKKLYDIDCDFLIQKDWTHTALYILFEALSEHKNFEFLDDLMNITKTGGIYIYGLPYYEFSEHYYKCLEDRITLGINSDNFNILLTHATVTGYEDINVKGSIDPFHEYFDKFDLILSGDIHKSRLFGDKFLMLGSPIHNKLDDFGEDKGFWDIEIKEDKTFELNFVSLNDKFPIFVKAFEGQDIPKKSLDKDYIVYYPAIINKPKNIDGNDEIEFNSIEDTHKLLRKYWQETDGKDNDLLRVGLDLL